MLRAAVRFPLVTLLACSALGACSDALAPGAALARRSPPDRQRGRPAPAPAAAPAFIFASNDGSGDQLFRWDAGVITRLTFTSLSNTKPHAAGGRLVFTSYRDGDAEIYLADDSAGAARRITASTGLDDEAALDPAATRVAFVSARTGTLRLYVSDTAGTSVVALETGSGTTVPERAPSWSPRGDHIAFTSNRDGTSQVYIVAGTGGAAVRVTRETIGAYDPVWAADGLAILYAASAGGPRLRKITLATGLVEDMAGSAAYGEPSCNAAGCLLTSNAYSGAGDIVWLPFGGTPTQLVATTGNDFHPAILLQ